MSIAKIAKRKKREERLLREVRRAEEEIAFATPTRAAKLATKIVRLKATVFDRTRAEHGEKRRAKQTT